MIFEPLELEDNEQFVFAVAARSLPTLGEFIAIGVVAPTLMLLPWLMVHRGFRRTVYVITTIRVIVAEPRALTGEIDLQDITRVRSNRTALVLHGKEGARLRVSRVPDAWYFETILRRVIRTTEGRFQA